VVRAGEVHLTDFGSPLGHEAGFRRPALVVSPEQLNAHEICIVLPITRTRRGYPTHVELDGPLPVVSYVQCELIRAISTNRLIRKVGVVDSVDRARIRGILGRLIDP
jgi:mRNA interferase MazF